MTGLLSNLVGNLADGIHKIKCQYGHDNKNVKCVELDKNAVSTQRLKVT